MEAVKNTAISLIISTVAGSLVWLVMPKGGMEKLARTVISIFVIGCVVLSVLTEESLDMSELAFSSQKTDASASRELSSLADAQLRQAAQLAVEEQIGALLAQAHAHAHSVEVTAESDKNNCIIIDRICIKLEKEDIGRKSEIEAFVQERLGIKPEVTA